MSVSTLNQRYKRERVSRGTRLFRIRWVRTLGWMIALGVFWLSMGCGTAPVDHPCGGECVSGFECVDKTCIKKCEEGQERCSGTCTKLQTDTTNCGACGIACKNGEECKAGKCEPVANTTCSDTETKCGEACIDTSASLQHCGACDNACKDGYACQSGKCELLCESGKTACGDKCVDTDESNEHCGKCDNACGSEKTCNAGNCECSSGKTACGDTCVDTDTDKANCGSCGNACSEKESCESGSCKLNCETGKTACNEKCVDTLSDATNCGACGNACPTGLICSKGLCGCLENQQLCNGTCVTVKSDPKNCGVCNNACGDKEVCTDGQCKSTCATGEVGCSGACVDLKTSTDHCGVCGVKCSTGQSCCDGKCVDLQTNASNCGTCAKTCSSSANACCGGGCVDTQSDTNNCGNCGNVCSGGRSCQQGACKCAKDTCGSVCVDLQTDSKNCGTCGNACQSGYACEKGVCLIQCSGSNTRCSNACVNIQSNNSHCGACGTVCSGGTSCSNGSCSCDSTTKPNLCSGVCTNFKTDILNCGSCGNKCANGQTCNNGTCVCPSTKSTLCGGVCTDTKVDLNNCGKCGNTCTGQAVCKAGKCEVCPNCPLWLNQGSGSSSVFSNAIAVDDSGNTYVTGYFSKSMVLGAYTFQSSNFSDMFVAKLDSNGNILWAKSAGGGGQYGSNQGSAIAVDKSGNVYVAGKFRYTITFGTLKGSNSGNSELFVAKFDKDGKEKWLKTCGSTDQTAAEHITGLALDSSSNVYITGYTEKTALFGTFKVTTVFGRDIFAAKLDTNGNWKWVKSAGSDSDDRGHAIAVDTQGNVYITGYFGLPSSTPKQATFGSTKLTSRGGKDVFVAKLNTNGAWQWAVQAGGASDDVANAITIDSAGAIHIAGTYSGSGAVFGNTSANSAGGTDIFVAKLTNSGAWSRAVRFGGTGDDGAQAIRVNSSGAIYVGGYFSNTIKFGSQSFTSNGNSDILVMRLNSNGGFYRAMALGSNSGSSEGANAIAIDKNNDIYTTGFFQNTVSFGGVLSLTSKGSWDMFIGKFRF